ncbi:MAG: molybdate ABC transporter substrate-binding protein [Alphaproteobacteria bacterium]|nr:MAG: molybdate ABC transporter substrate-binding protein [Alphaproteobacteria bacterium]
MLACSRPVPRARPRVARLALFLWILLALLQAGSPARAGELLVFAAASQRDALDAIIAAYEKSRPEARVKAAYQASSTLARQIELGAPADVFIAANVKWMEYLQARGLIDPESRADLVSNRLVLVAVRNGPATAIDIKAGATLTAWLGDGLLAVGDPEHVPAGMYAREALQKLGMWTTLKDRLARADNSRVALALVARGGAPLGIVYESDAVAHGALQVVARFPASSHSPIRYPAAVTRASRHGAEAGEFLAFLRAPAAAELYRKFGFRPPGAATN